MNKRHFHYIFIVKLYFYLKKIFRFSGPGLIVHKILIFAVVSVDIKLTIFLTPDFEITRD
jgi:hypothetical protein